VIQTAPTRRSAFVRILVFAVLFEVAVLLLYPLLSRFEHLIGVVMTQFAAAVLISMALLRLYDRGNLTDSGLSWSPASLRHAALGLVGGLGAAFLALGVPLLAGGATLVESNGETPSAGAFFFVTVLLVFGAFGEELLFRGYAFQLALAAFGQWASILPMAVLFGWAHSNNPGAGNLALFNTAAWGAVLGWAVVRTGDLWLAIALHLGWNWALLLFGVNLSGLELRVVSHSMQWKLDEVWTGGGYGPEAGLLCTAALVAVTAFLWWAPIVKQPLPVADRLPAGHPE
jgi:membrane protease YdiL (CAAX protease family)